MDNIQRWHVPELNSFLRKRMISYSGKRKADLVKLVEAAIQLGLPTEDELGPADDRGCQARLDQLGLQNPFKLDPSVFSTDLSYCPTFGLYDIFNYLLKNRSDYDRKKLKAYKSATDYRLFIDGHVEHLEYWDNGDHQFGVFRGEVRIA